MAVVFLDYYGALIYVITLILYAAPIKSMFDLYRHKDIWRVPYNFYMISIVNCLFWIIYGLQKDIWPIWAVNIPGLICLICYILVYLSFIEMKKYEYVIMLIALPVKASFIFYVFYFYVDLDINGYIAMTFNTIMFLLPTEQIYHTIKAKNNQYIELWLALSIFLNTLVYFIYGILLSDNWYMIIPNFLGFFVACAQLYVWWFYRDPNRGYEKVNRIEHMDNNEEDQEMTDIDTSIE